MSVLITVLTLLAIHSVAHADTSSCNVLAPAHLRILPEDTFPQAKCLDGTQGSYYYRPSQDGSEKWILFFQGGAWCTLEGTPSQGEISVCSYRAGTDLGSSRNLIHYNPPNFNTMGILAPATWNPYCSWNVVYMNYCDGASFSGTIGAVHDENANVTLHLSGRYILEAIMNDLNSVSSPLNHKLGNATDVIVSGCSAGGFASMLHVDWIRDTYLPNSFVVAVPGSGFFLPYNRSGEYQEFMLQVAYDHYPPTDSLCSISVVDYRYCMIPEVVYKYITTPTFIINSLYDEWQLFFVILPVPELSIVVPESTCFLRNNMLNLLESISTSIGYRGDSSKNGGFLFTCISHCLESYGYFQNVLQINGITLIQAIQEWYDMVKNDSPVSRFTPEFIQTACDSGTSIGGEVAGFFGSNGFWLVDKWERFGFGNSGSGYCLEGTYRPFNDPWLPSDTQIEDVFEHLLELNPNMSLPVRNETLSESNITDTESSEISEPEETDVRSEETDVRSEETDELRSDEENAKSRLCAGLLMILLVLY